jgi:hypothetical protein
MARSIKYFGGQFETANIVYHCRKSNGCKNLPIQFNQGINGQAFDRLHENGGLE